MTLTITAIFGAMTLVSLILGNVLKSWVDYCKVLIIMAFWFCAIWLGLLNARAYAATMDDNIIAVIYTQDNAIDIEEAPPIIEEEPSLYSGISISDEEGQLLEKILWAEANNQSFEGQKAVIEVIFNRVLSDKWPNTVYDVLSQKGQFSTWKYRDKVTPTEVQSDVISDVLRETETVLPDMEYVYFDTKGVNGKKHIRIGGHVFGK